MVWPCQSSPDHLNESAIALKSKLSGFRLERRLVGNQRQLVLNERAEGFGNKVELPGKLVVGPT
jgi:hypothetical protein